MSAATVPGDATETLAARAVQVTKIYGQGQTEVRALDNVSVEFPSGRFTAIMGPSGSGKSTLMHCLAGLDRITSGQIFIGDVEVNKLNEKQLTLLRRDKVGFVFQAFNLLPTLTAAENVELPLAIAGRKPRRVPWPPSRRSCSPTSPPATSTRPRAPSCSASCAARSTTTGRRS
jgi:putative ABC transport system ATP-binding protein